MSDRPAATVRVVGPGRAGGSVLRALLGVGWSAVGSLGRGDDLTGAAEGTDLLILAVPDPAIASVAAEVAPVDSTVVVHLAGSLGLDVLAPHPRRGALHPLVSMPDPEIGAGRLPGAWFAVAGDPLVDRVVADLSGHAFVVDDAHRGDYHAAAVIASNHLVALLGQAERVAATAGVPLEAFFDLVRATVDNVEALGPAAALTGPVARGDWETVARHLEVIPPDEREAYVAMARAARRLVDPTGPGLEL